MENQRICANCKNFKRYYTLNVCFRFTPIDKGYCINRKVRRGGSKREVEQNESCDLWQTNELLKLEGQYTAENVLRDINEKLEAVRILLDKDKI